MIRQTFPHSSLGLPRKTTPLKRPLLFAFAPLALLVSLSAINGIVLAGTRTAETKTPSAIQEDAPVPPSVSGESVSMTPREIRRMALSSSLSASRALRLFGWSLQRECQSSPNHTVTLSQQEIAQFCRRAADSHPGK